MEKTFGDCTVRKQYSHIDLLHMIDGVEMQKATVAAGNRCYYLKVCVHVHVHVCLFMISYTHVVVVTKQFTSVLGWWSL